MMTVFAAKHREILLLFLAVSPRKWLAVLLLNFHVMRTYITFWLSSNFSQIGPLTVELAAFKHLLSPYRIRGARWPGG